MDKFATLEPVKLHNDGTSPTPAHRSFLGGFKPSSKPLANRDHTILHLIGKLPADLHLHVLEHLAIPDLPAYGRTCRAFAEFTRDERVWEAKWNMIGLERLGLDGVLNELEKLKQPAQAVDIADDIEDDDFGDFASASSNAGTLNSFRSLSLQGGLSLSSHPAVLFPNSTATSKPMFRSKFIRVHALLAPYLPHLLSPPHLVLASLFPPSPPPPSLIKQAQILHLLARYLAPSVAPVRQHSTLASSLRAAIDRFQASLLSVFDRADTVSDYVEDNQDVSNKDEEALREAARASWEVWEGKLPVIGSSGISALSTSMRVSDWELGRVWCEKREIFYEQGRWKPVDNFTYVHYDLSYQSLIHLACMCISDRDQNKLDFNAMDEFMNHVITALHKDGGSAVRIFPPESYVVLSFAERLTNEVVSNPICYTSCFFHFTFCRSLSTLLRSSLGHGKSRTTHFSRRLRRPSEKHGVLWMNLQNSTMKLRLLEHHRHNKRLLKDPRLYMLQGIKPKM